jgi:hypothetical protein
VCSQKVVLPIISRSKAHTYISVIFFEELEDATLTVIISYVGEVEQEDGHTLTLGDILSFFTGSTGIPPMGFNDVGTLNFNSTNVFPTALTCSFTLLNLFKCVYSTPCIW